MWQGQRVSETFHGLSPLKPRDTAIARRMMADIIERIGHGTFDYAGTFPDSPRAKSSAGIRTLGDALDSFMDGAPERLEPRTLTQYKNAAQEWRDILGEDLVLERAIPSEIKKKIFSIRWSSAARFNNCMIPLRGALRAAMADNGRLKDLLAEVPNMDKEEGAPNPLSPEQTAGVLKHVRENYGDRQWAWFAFAFSTGLRPSEQCVLLYTDIKDGKVNVSKAQNPDGSIKATKTKGKRKVDLAPLAIDAVNISKSWKNENGEVFQNPWSEDRWLGNKSQHENIWTPTLKALEIPHRRAYCTRHTFASTLLAKGARVLYVSAQLGHTSPTMVETTYAEHLPGADGGYNTDILAGAFA
ncbi:MAG: tyrosine-type recombinase/integrase [Hydrogenophaga sp.]|uniref:site-specific integrase n=1 Tax=Hydrogenophaga sp. TaxID=1904254 RepID=UPI002AB803CD|nr:tyrosine-type recombinase/integrase [Hydrogenophaga sp.]MDZ4282840.1 tyrosine-type recombinase/integrase [Hydrogenophaga sp.]